MLAYLLRPDGSVGPKRLLHDFGTQRGIDGMCLDADGNIYAAAGAGKSGGVYIFDPTGKRLGFVAVPETPTTA